jgi:hypothetical protein
MPKTQPVCTARARTRVHVARAFGLELIQNAGAKEKNNTSHAIHEPDESNSPFRVELSKAGRERNAQITIQLSETRDGIATRMATFAART